jgi:hypothetical protein
MYLPLCFKLHTFLFQYVLLKLLFVLSLGAGTVQWTQWRGHENRRKRSWISGRCQRFSFLRNAQTGPLSTEDSFPGVTIPSNLALSLIMHEVILSLPYKHLSLNIPEGASSSDSERVKRLFERYWITVGTEIAIKETSLEAEPTASNLQGRKVSSVSRALLSNRPVVSWYWDRVRFLTGRYRADRNLCLSRPGMSSLGIRRADKC